MFPQIRSGCSYVFTLAEKGLAHPSFLGRAVSWGIFYGALYVAVSKIVRYVHPIMHDLLEKFDDYCISFRSKTIKYFKTLWNGAEKDQTAMKEEIPESKSHTPPDPSENDEGSKKKSDPE